MRTSHRITLLAYCMVAISVAGMGQAKYIGTKSCSMCHKTEKQGNQLGIWQKSKHADAYKSLLTAEADSIAKAKGSKKPAAESPECLQCHVVGHDVAANLLEKDFDMKDGVQCESCHGPGSGYKTIQIMKDRAKSIAAGLRVYEDDEAKEKLCRTCHNEKSPMFKGFNFKEMWAKIKHTRPKG